LGIYGSIEKINVLNCSKIKNMEHLMIERNPEIMFGKPVIKGTRITVEFLMRKFADGFNVEEILEMYPHLTLAQILAAFAYAADIIANEIVIEAA
jgi:uncharacterized protein (DUF433 family)